MAIRFARARAQAVSRGAAVALRFTGAREQTILTSFVDGDRDGVLTRDIEAGIDSPVDEPVALAALFPGVVIVDDAEPRLFTFSPDGTSTTGSVTLESRDGSRFAVRVSGATARVRIERYVVARDAWVESF